MKYLYWSDKLINKDGLRLIRKTTDWRAWCARVMFDQAIIPVRYASDGKLVAYISQLFDRENHLGIDWGRSTAYENADGSLEIPEIVACRAGTVVKVRHKYKDTAGKYVTVKSIFFDWSSMRFKHEFWQYKHLSEIDVKVGQKVHKGQKLGKMGGTGGEWRKKDGSAPLYVIHLHLSRRVRGLNLVDLFTGLGRKKTETNSLNVIRYTEDDILTSTTKKYVEQGIFKKTA